ncbi:MAG: CU044_2847 family protein, partial [Mucilaginibacter sp.]
MKNDIIVFNVDGQSVYIEGEIPRESGQFIADAGEQQVVSAIDSFESTMEPVISFARNIVKKINSIDINKPTEIEVQFGIKLT